MEKVKEEIKQILKEIEERQKLQDHLDSVNDDLNDAYLRLKDLEKKMNSEYSDIQRFEESSLKSIFKKFSKLTEEDIERERQEYFQAALNFNDWKKAIKLKEFEIEVLVNKIDLNKQLDRKLEHLKSKMAMSIAHTDSLEGKVIVRIDNKIAKNNILNKELNDVIDTGVVCTNQINEVMKIMNQLHEVSVRSMGDSSYYYRSARRQLTDKLGNSSQFVNHYLNKFQKELSDIGQRNSTLKLNFDVIYQLSRFKIGNILSDVVIFERLKRLYDNMSYYRDLIDSVIVEMRKKIAETREENKGLRAERDRIILEEIEKD